MNDPKLKQKIAEHIRDSANILVTVSNDPSVDELSAALGLTLLLNKMEKHATAVFSGKIPPAITFLDPEKTFEDTTDSLRDFIIALDKDKADHLRYKLEGDLVKIYITPYRSTITDDDLEFSQGDYNVELIIALGVESKDHLDTALASHGQILDDATVVTLTSGNQKSELGKIDWHDNNASSLSEMLMSLFETLKADKKLLDHAIATAWMTGIVAATERFSNARTTSRAMTLSAQLMAAGADQQLIVSRLSTGQTAEEEVSDIKQASSAGSKKAVKSTAGKASSKKKSDDGALVISHGNRGDLDEVAKAVDQKQAAASTEAAEAALKDHQASLNGEHHQVEGAVSNQAGQVSEDSLGTGGQPSDEVSSAVDAPTGTEQPSGSRHESDSNQANLGAVEYTPPTSPSPAKISGQTNTIEPSFGGTLNATSSQAAEDKRREEAGGSNKVILSHSRYVGDSEPTYTSALNGALEAKQAEQPLSPLGDSNQATATDFLETPSPLDGPAQLPNSPQPEPPTATSPPEEPTLADLDRMHREPSQPQNDEVARADVAAAFSGQSPSDNSGLPLPPPPPPPPADLAAGLPPLPPIPGQEPERLGDILAQDQPHKTTSLPPAPTPPPAQLNDPSDPGQFRIPGQ